MKLTNCLFVVLFLTFVNGCVERYRDVKFPDIKAMKTNKNEFKFDFQEFKKKYGEPPIIDNKQKEIGYYAKYKYASGYTGFTVKPYRLEYWYLILTPTGDSNSYTGERYFHWFGAIESKELYGDTDYPDVKPLKDIEKIKKCKSVKPDFYFDKTKAIDYRPIKDIEWQKQNFDKK
jgi:hypothetical protein